MRVPESPPERVDLGDVVVRRLTVADAAAIATAVRENLEHLRPWMPWANPESADERFQRRRLVEADGQWARGADFGYGLFAATGDDERLLGAFGLTARRGARTLEIGYWLRADATRRGLATRAVEALTDIAVNQPDVERVLVYCDEANHASAAVPRRLGYRLERVVSVPPEATAETGRQLEFVLRADEWRARRAAKEDR
jgi:RimJ/RimL family protein N-acetyltransferase